SNTVLTGVRAVEFYLNVVGYKPKINQSFSNIIIQFYLNVVGYKRLKCSLTSTPLCVSFI
ncbi:hypothetical protein P4S91_20805, partial [Aneurinibacillus aneurinilyticus]|nr:hypothetical protein [Aneurinibacillus aneurinilyticus]